MLIKKNRFDQAVKVLEEKKNLLEKAYEKLYDLNQEKEEVLKHKNAKLSQLRDSLDEGVSSDKIQHMKSYLKIVMEQLKEKEKKVAAQQAVVDAAQKQVDQATADLFQKKKDVEKLELHKGEWEKEVRYLTEQKEGVEHDEQGSSVYTTRKREAKKRNN